MLHVPMYPPEEKGDEDVLLNVEGGEGRLIACPSRLGVDMGVFCGFFFGGGGGGATRSSLRQVGLGGERDRRHRGA